MISRGLALKKLRLNSNLQSQTNKNFLSSPRLFLISSPSSTPQSLIHQPNPISTRYFSSSISNYDAKEDPISFSDAHFGPNLNQKGKESSSPSEEADETPAPSATEHAVISTFDLFSIGIGPSSSHTVGPMRAGAIFVGDLREAGLLNKCSSIKISLYGSLAATGEGHLTPSALLLGLEGADCETVEPDSVGPRFEEIKQKKTLRLGRDSKGALGGVEVKFDYQNDLAVS